MTDSSVARTLTADHFLELVNRALPREQHVRFTTKINGVFVGPCPTSGKHGHVLSALAGMTDWVHENREGILVLCRCCGQYQNQDQDRIIEAYSEARWTFPHTAGFPCDAGAPDLLDVAVSPAGDPITIFGAQLAKWLLDFGIAERNV